MKGLWWQLPGPARFIRNVENVLRDGRCAVILTPQTAPAGLGRAVRDRLEAGRLGYTWTSLDARRLARSAPHEALYEALVSDPPDDLYTVRGLAGESELANHIVWVEHLPVEQWPAWKRFIADYADVLHARGASHSPLFVLVHAAIPEEAWPPDRLQLARLQWSGHVDRLDMQLYAASLLNADHQAHIKRDIAAMTVAALAMWDPELAQDLAQATIQDLCQPQALLARYAQERGWGEKPPEGDWLDGSKCLFAGREQTHSAMLAVHEGKRELERRVWRAQVGVLFPYLEEQRLELVSSLQSELSAPYIPDERYPNTVIDSIYDLELTHICKQLEHGTYPYSPEWQQGRRLKKVRDALAHLTPVRYPDLAAILPQAGGLTRFS